MKDIKYNNEEVEIEFKYKSGFLGIGVDDGYTDFFHGEEVKDKFSLFGIGFGGKIVKPKFAFRIDLNIEDPFYNKEEVKSHIKAGFDNWLRKIQISKGNII